MEFVVGQRWVSQAEPQLGLGLVIETDGRHITLSFPALEEERIYAANSAPLARVLYQVGDSLNDIDNNALVVTAIEELNQLNYYLTTDNEGAEHIVPESKISAQIQLSSPTQRLFSGQFDRNSAFQLCAATLHFRYQLQCSEARGLLGPRTNLLKHQIYIAHEVASRYAPRVLLADEVGLGKTIEAGMILHHQLQTGLASRALIVVPEPLLHQWLVEMLRKFNLHFSLFDKGRYNAIIEADEGNPFESEQLILCSLDLLCSDKALMQKACDAGWDLMIVDEAHHLRWSEEAPSVEYQAIEQLSRYCAGLLLLTATPEQVGLESHFARLRLLDPARFHSLPSFIEEQGHFVELNSIVSSLANKETLSAEQQKQLSHYIGELPESHSKDNSEGDDHQLLIRRLLDRHGTGRVLFRNTRAAIKGFPQRLEHGYPLESVADYQSNQGLYPERALQEAGEDWLAIDPRVEWLEGFLKSVRGQKVLLICANPNTALDLEKHLHLTSGIRSTAFYEGLSIIERDRAAAYFADEDAGAQVLICSEIGSEGRNFQFAHHLVLFDLPMNPDLLEQRIGRLDRIGQSEDIKIHIPYISGTAQEYLYRWYNEGIDALSHSFSAGLSVYQLFETRLAPWINTDSPQSTEDFEALITETAVHTQAVRDELQNGRDHLLELNSCDNDVAENVIQTIIDSERSEVLQSYMTMLLDTFGVDHDFHSEHCLVLHPSDHMLTGYFPGLKEEGVTVCFDRAKAQQREEMEFITWENPMISEAMEMVSSMDIGNVAIAALKLKAIPAGTLMIECFFAIQCSAPKKYQVDRFLPATPIRVLLESSGKDLTAIIKHAQMNKLAEHVKKSTRLAILKQIRGELEKMIGSAQTIAQGRAQPLITAAQERVASTMGEELNRLTELKQLNGTIREEEIEFVASRQSEALAHIANASAELKAIRVLINT